MAVGPPSRSLAHPDQSHLPAQELGYLALQLMPGAWGALSCNLRVSLNLFHMRAGYDHGRIALLFQEVGSSPFCRILAEGLLGNERNKRHRARFWNYDLRRTG